MGEDNREVKIVENEDHQSDGQIKCPKCGSTDIQSNPKTGKLRCNFCRHEFDLDLAREDEDIASLHGTTIRSGAQDIDKNSEDLVTLKCESCGAEVVIDTKSSTQARCHWCRNTLSLNNQVPNGAVPDVLLPFSVTKEDAEEEIAKFVRKRRFFAHPTFTRQFSTENICGVYIPYMLVDVNAHMSLSGQGEIQTAKREVGDEKNKHYEYDADLYRVKRDFDIYVDDLSIESSSDKLDYSSKSKTTNIINAVMPFDTENCVRFNTNYLKGCTSEKRDTNIGVLKEFVDAQSSDVARIAAKDTLIQYDRGVRWDEEDFEVKGDSWKSAYLPIWLYSYMEKKGKSQLLHYVAVNARTRETMGSVPINFTKLFFFAVLVEIFSGLAAFVINLIAAMDRYKGTGFQDSRHFFYLLLASGFIFYTTMYLRYRNSNERHHYELETKYEISNMVKVDDFIRSNYGMTNQEIVGENASSLKGNRLDLHKDEVLEEAIEKGDLDQAIENKKKMEEMDERDEK